MKRVEVYFNLHKRLFSVRDVKSGLVIAHMHSVHLEDVTFKVSEAGRRRVLRTKRKNVHAVCRGRLASAHQGRGYAYLSYNPYKGPTFYRKASGAPVATAGRVHLNLVDGRPVMKGWGTK